MLGLNFNIFSWRWTLISVTTFFLLWGTFFIEIQVPLLVGLLLAVNIIYFRMFGHGRLDRLGLLLLANIFYWLISGFLVGSIKPLDLLNMKLWNGDGRIIISSIPFLFFALVQVRYHDLKHAINTMVWMGLIGMALYLLWMFTHVSWLAGPGHPDEFHAFLSSHTGAGTFFGCLATFTLAYGYEKKSLPLALLGLSLFGPTFSSGSRESLVGLMAAIGWYMVIRNPKPKLILVSMVVGGILFVTLPSFISQKTYERTYGLLSWSFVTSAIAQAERAIKSDWQTGDWTAETGTESLEEGDVTSLVRIQLWVYATKRFLASPLFGMGWGRFNDRNIHLIDAPPFLSVAARGGQVISPETAHNSYFHLAAESGIIGLVMYLSLWGIIYYRCQRAIQLMKSIDELRAFFIAAQALIVFILTCALTGHALGSPSVMLPTMVILGVAVSFLRGNLYRAENVRLVPMARSA